MKYQSGVSLEVLPDGFGRQEKAAPPAVQITRAAMKALLEALRQADEVDRMHEAAFKPAGQIELASKR